MGIEQMESKVPLIMANCLNPCSNGMGIEQHPELLDIPLENCLNPCSNGMGIEQRKNNEKGRHQRVLILVLMEWGLS